MTSNSARSYCGVNVAVLGASGFIGRHVVHTLSEGGANLSLLVRSKALAARVLGACGVRGDVFELDVRDSQAVGDLFREIRPTITFNLAAYGVDPAERDERAAWEINADLVRALLEVIAAIREPAWPGQDLVHVGSALEYGAIGGNLAEDSLPSPTTLYGRSKLAGTRLLGQCSGAYAVKSLTARLFTVYGPGEHAGRLLPSLLETARTGRPLRLTNGEQRRDFTYVEDVAEGLLRLGVARTAPGRVVNLATGSLVSVRRFAETAARILGIPRDLLRLGAVPTRPEEMAHDAVSVDRLRRIAGWVPSTTVEEGIRRTAKSVPRHARIAAPAGGT
jgi:nucleoside-diphosphate-sugar epimerase